MTKEIKPTPIDTTNHYVDNVQLYEDIKKWKSTYDQDQKMPESIAVAIIAICEKLVNRYNFSGYSQNWKEDMVADGIYDGIKGLHNFDPERSKNPFAYISQTAYFAFVRRIKTEKQQLAIMYQNFVSNVYDNVSDEINPDEEFIQDIHSKITEYEQSTKVTKKKNEQTLEDLLGI